MGWIGRFFTSSIGQKTLMGLTGLFLILFLAVHLAGNLQLLQNDGGVAFNTYADFMGSNPLIQFISKGNFFFIALHAVLGLYLYVRNKMARGGQKYAVQNVRAVNTHPGFAKNMAILGTILLVFILIHLYQFWMFSYFDLLDTVTIDGKEVNNLYGKVALTFSDPLFVIFYVICMAVVGFHLWHGFQSAFQTFGLNHPKYSPTIRFLGKAYSVLVPLGFATIPIVFYLRKFGMISFFEKYQPELNRVFERHHVLRAFAFGSVLKEDFGAESDVDLMVVFDEKGDYSNFKNYFSLLGSLENLFARVVDLMEEKPIRNPVLREEIERTKQLIYGKESPEMVV